MLTLDAVLETASLSDKVDRLMLADLLDGAGRELEARLLRTSHPEKCLDCHTLNPPRDTWGPRFDGQQGISREGAEGGGGDGPSLGRFESFGEFQLLVRAGDEKKDQEK